MSVHPFQFGQRDTRSLSLGQPAVDGANRNTFSPGVAQHDGAATVAGPVGLADQVGGLPSRTTGRVTLDTAHGHAAAKVGEGLLDTCSQRQQGHV